MSTPFKKCNPNWLSRQDPNDPELNPNYKRSVEYYTRLYNAWPDWAAEDPRVAAIYREAKRLRKMGHDVEIDHIVPISHPLVCGLHVYDNLQISDKVGNANKSNRWWPEMPDDLQLPLL